MGPTEPEKNSIAAELQSWPPDLTDQKLCLEFCMTLDAVPQQLAHLVAAVPAMFSEWTSRSSHRNGDCTVDTRHLGAQLRARLLNELQSDLRIDGALYNCDNITFLDTIQNSLKGKVRLFYIDPPYNTGNTHYSYKDNFERSEWLSMMENVISRVVPLLTTDGSICLSIDDSEMPYLRVLMDRIVGEKYFVACVAYERSGSAGLGQGSVILNTKEYILIYSLDKRKLNDVGYERPINREVMKRYCKVLVDEGQRRLIKEIETQTDSPARLYEHNRFQIRSISLKDFEKRRSEIDSQFIDSFDKIFRTQNVQKESSFQSSIIAGLSKETLYSLEYVPQRGRYKDSQKTLYYFNRELCAWLKDSSSVQDGTIIKRNKLTDFWSHAEIPKADLANEGGVLFSRSKKPEHLLYRLLALTTESGDLVIDLFAGSGTTAAVAHKMSRRWLAVERGDYFLDCPVSRLKNVVGGDPTGVSKLSGWRGGGTFAYYHPSGISEPG